MACFRASQGHQGLYVSEIATEGQLRLQGANSKSPWYSSRRCSPGGDSSIGDVCKLLTRKTHRLMTEISLSHTIYSRNLFATSFYEGQPSQQNPRLMLLSSVSLVQVSLQLARCKNDLPVLTDPAPYVDLLMLCSVKQRSSVH